jgi:hypothetical protein
MLSKETVFLLGAGANVPYGFSTGRGLVVKAQQSNLLTVMGNAGQQVNRSEVLRFAAALDDNLVPSIDALLEHRQDLVRVGKRIMATLLYQEEAAARALDPDTDWMQLVFERMAEGAPTLERFAENPVTFVTFNYDRYLEHRFIRGLVARYNVPAEQAWAAIARMKFLHLHGSLGRLLEQGPAPQGQQTIALGAPDLPGVYTLGLALPQAENLLRIVHDFSELPPIFAEAQAYLA